MFQCFLRSALLSSVAVAAGAYAAGRPLEVALVAATMSIAAFGVTRIWTTRQERETRACHAEAAEMKREADKLVDHARATATKAATDRRELAGKLDALARGADERIAEAGRIEALVTARATAVAERERAYGERVRLFDMMEAQARVVAAWTDATAALAASEAAKADAVKPPVDVTKEWPETLGDGRFKRVIIPARAARAQYLDTTTGRLAKNSILAEVTGSAPRLDV